VNQREVHADTHPRITSLRAALRENPDVVLIGEMRISRQLIACGCAEDRPLTFATLHTNSGVFPPSRLLTFFLPQQPQIAPSCPWC